MLEIQDVLKIFPGSKLITPELTPRRYQLDAIEQAREATRQGHTHILIVAPPGSGKTFVASLIIQSAIEKGTRCMFVVHRRELIDQAYEALTSLGVSCGVIRGDDERSDPNAGCFVASIQTLSARKNYPDVGLVVPDEAHLSSSEGWRNMLAHYPEAIVIGLSGSPTRLDSKPMGDYFTIIVQPASYSELISEGSILKPTVFSSRESVDLSCVHTVRGDYDSGELGHVMTRPKILGSVVDTWFERADGESTLLYAVNVDHSKALVERFNARRPRVAEHIDGSTPSDERAAIWARLKSGETKIVANCQLATEGFNEPRVACVSLARPTQSLALYLQMTGRPLRPYPGKRARILDHGQNFERHGHPTQDREWSLTTKSGHATTPQKFRMCPLCYAWRENNPCEHCNQLTPREVYEVEADESVVLEEVAEAPEHLARRKRLFFERALRRAQHGGFKPTMPPAAYRNEFGGEWPSELAKEAAALFLKDREWQRRYNERLAAQGKKEMPEAWSDE